MFLNSNSDCQTSLGRTYLQTLNDQFLVSIQYSMASTVGWFLLLYSLWVHQPDCYLVYITHYFMNKGTKEPQPHPSCWCYCQIGIEQNCKGFKFIVLNCKLLFYVLSTDGFYNSHQKYVN